MLAISVKHLRDSCHSKDVSEQTKEIQEAAFTVVTYKRKNFSTPSLSTRAILNLFPSLTDLIG